MTRTELLQSVSSIEFDQQETFKVLRANLNIYFSWGISSAQNFYNKVLVLKVSGHHHKGLVLISLAWNDTYTVTLASTHNKVKKTITDVYFDQLVKIIDKEIEYVEAYK